LNSGDLLEPDAKSAEATCSSMPMEDGRRDVSPTRGPLDGELSACLALVPVGIDGDLGPDAAGDHRTDGSSSGDLLVPGAEGEDEKEATPAPTS